MDSLTWTLAASLMENGINIFTTALGLGLVIFFHELGHFAVAKWCDVNVERFSIGFGPVIFGWKWGETDYVLSAIPFGGYVKMLGQDDSDPSQLTNEEIANDPRSYSAKPVWQRMAIISAGVTMNLITAILFFAIAYSYGIPTLPPIVGDASPGSPAWVAGLEPGDRVERINGHKVNSWLDIPMYTALSDNTVRLEGRKHDGEAPFSVTMEPWTHKNHPSITHPQIGLRPTFSSLQLSNDPKSEEPPVVKGTAAARATPAFAPGDRITEVDGKKIDAFSDLQRALAGRSVPESEIVVERNEREGAPKAVTIHVGADYFRTLGIRMDCGPIVALQHGSIAEKAGFKAGDKGDKLLQVNGLNVGTDIDPLKLPTEFAKWAGQDVEIVVKRQKEGGGTENVTVHVVPTDRPGWVERPDMEGDPVSIPSIGLAFHIIPQVVSVEPDSPAAEAGIKPESRITSVTIEPNKAENPKAEPLTLSLDDPKDQRRENNWAVAFWQMQTHPHSDVSLTVMEGNKPRVVKLTPKIDPDWMLPMIGLRMTRLEEKLQARSIGEAFDLAWHKTGSTVLTIYMTLRSLTITQRLSITELNGPLRIAQATYLIASQGVSLLLDFLGMLSVNLAVINFLPIPILDGGHMVFLMWEGLTRRKPSERVVIGATYMGLAFILCLTVLVFYNDITHLIGVGR